MKSLLVCWPFVTVVYHFYTGHQLKMELMPVTKGICRKPSTNKPFNYSWHNNQFVQSNWFDLGYSIYKGYREVYFCNENWNHSSNTFHKKALFVRCIIGKKNSNQNTCSSVCWINRTGVTCVLISFIIA